MNSITNLHGEECSVLYVWSLSSFTSLRDQSTVDTSEYTRPRLV